MMELKLQHSRQELENTEVSMFLLFFTSLKGSLWHFHATRVSDTENV